MACTAPLLRPGAPEDLHQAFDRYPDHYDDVLNEVHDRLVQRGVATKLDLAALIAWKHVRNAHWMKDLLKRPEIEVEVATRAAFSPGLTDNQRIAALDPLPGFGGRGAFTSVLLTAWDPTNFGVFDRLAYANRPIVVSETCVCDWALLPVYWAHLRTIASEMSSGAGGTWTPRMVDMALMNL
ncbi:MAG: hypothetical protein AMXMBFR46_18830 [Acidimicrobiia bacterium]